MKTISCAAVIGGAVLVSLLPIAGLSTACSSTGGSGGDGGVDAGTDEDTETESDTDTASDTGEECEAPFADPVPVSADLFAYRLVPADLDLDGDPDLVADVYGPEILIVENDSANISNWPHTDHGIYGAMHWRHCVGDLNSDDYPDLAVTFPDEFGEAVIGWWENPGTSSTWGEHTVEMTPQYYIHLSGMADVDGDGDQDISAIALEDSSSVTHIHYWIENADGSGTSWIQRSLPQSGYPFPMDVDGDGDIDFMTRTPSPDDGFAWLENTNGDGMDWLDHSILVVGEGLDSYDFSDVNGDGLFDVVYMDAGHLRLLLNSGNASEPWQSQHISDLGDDSFSPVGADLDGDGDGDLVRVVRNLYDAEPAEHALEFLENLSGDGSEWESVMLLEFGDLPPIPVLFLSDMDGDGDADLLSSGGDDGTYYWQNCM